MCEKKSHIEELEVLFFICTLEDIKTLRWQFVSDWNKHPCIDNKGWGDLWPAEVSDWWLCFLGCPKCLQDCAGKLSVWTLAQWQAVCCTIAWLKKTLPWEVQSILSIDYIDFIIGLIYLDEVARTCDTRMLIALFRLEICLVSWIFHWTTTKLLVCVCPCLPFAHMTSIGIPISMDVTSRWCRGARACMLHP